MQDTTLKLKSVTQLDYIDMIIPPSRSWASDDARRAASEDYIQLGAQMDVSRAPPSYQYCQ